MTIETKGLVLSEKLSVQSDSLFPMLYRELRTIAHAVLRRESKHITLRTTALVNETYLKLSRGANGPWKNREHFLSTAARAMRQVLVDYFKEKKRKKRGGGIKPQPLQESDGIVMDPGIDILALDEALTKLSALDARKAQIVELRFFGGLTIEEAAKILEVPRVTILKDWAIAKGWLHREMSRGERCGA